MMRKGDGLTVALMIVNVILICLFVLKGAVPTSGTFSETHAVDLAPSPLPTAEPSATAQPSPTMVLAVNKNSTLFAIVQSSPGNNPSSATVAPSPSPTATPAGDNSEYVITARPTISSFKTALDNKTKPKAIPSYGKVPKPRTKHYK